jgi:D-arabinose 5-phosphate isomerase GutQ
MQAVQARRRCSDQYTNYERCRLVHCSTFLRARGFHHHMRHCQPERATPAQVLATGDPYRHARITLGGVAPLVPKTLTLRRVFLIGFGTSYHACLAIRPLLESLSGVPVTLELASDLMDRRPLIFRGDTAVFVSQSGETADTLAALRHARAGGALTVGVTNGVGSALSRETDCGVHLNAGYEMGVASTKARRFSSALRVLMRTCLVGWCMAKMDPVTYARRMYTLSLCRHMCRVLEPSVHTLQCSCRRTRASSSRSRCSRCY